MKSARHEKIVELIQKYDIDTQEELAARLLAAGFKVTQATVSRDIRALNMTKIAGRNGKMRYTILEGKGGADSGNKYSRVLNEAVLSAEAAQNLVVIHTAPGMAMAVAAAVDAFRWPEVLGSIAGDDTIMCAVHTEEEGTLVAGRLNAMLV